jgi:hypothetical protein
MFRYFIESLLKVSDIAGTEVLMLPLAYAIGTILNFILHWIFVKRDFMPKESFIIKTFLDKKIPYRIPLLVISYLAMSLTYSRSTYLSFLIAFIFIAKHFKKFYILLFSFGIMLLTILLLPRLSGEGTKLERTSSITAKIKNYQEALIVFKKSPLIGIGYNNIPFIRDIKIPNSHANSGFDGSLATIFVSTGLIGGILFLLGLKILFKKLSLLQKIMFVVILFHSIFANSLLYPWILISLIFF